jgi:ribonuclease R
MGERVGMEFEGIISGVTSWGIYVEEKKSGSEGLVGIHNLGDDYFVYNRNTYSIAGKQSRKKFSLGDKVKIKVKSIDLRRKQIDYTLVE